MKNILLILLVGILSLSIQAQDLHFEWAKPILGYYSNHGQSIAVDNLGNVYTVGYFSGTTDFDPGLDTFSLTPNNSTSWGYLKDIFIQKLDRNGNFIWAKSFGGSSMDQGLSLSIDPSNNLYLTGFYSDTVDFNPDSSVFNMVSKGLKDVFVLKLNSDGEFIWVKSIGGTSDDFGTSISVDASGNVYTLGHYYGTVDFDPGSATYNITSNGFWDVFVQKLDSNGNFIWVKSMGGTSDDQSSFIKVSAQGNIYVTGNFEGTADFDPDTSSFNMTSAGDFDSFILKFDQVGNFIWAKSMGSVLNDWSYSLTVDANENIYTVGFYRGTVDFDPGTSTYNLTSINGSVDGFIQKLDNNGNFKYAKSFSGTYSTEPISITNDGLNNMYITGAYWGTVDFDPDTSSYNLTSNGGNDIFILKLDSIGEFVWAKAIGGNGSYGDVGTSIVNSASEKLYVTGYFGSWNMDFDPDTSTYLLSKYHQEDAFALKLSSCGSKTGIDVIYACDSITWLDGKTYTSSNYSATHIITDSNGCDSIVTLNFTVATNSSTTRMTACKSYTWINGITYTESNDTATYTLTNSKGCDSVVSLDLTIYNLETSVIVDDPKITSVFNSGWWQWLDCNDDYSEITFENSKSFRATTNGEYAVEVSQPGCIDTSICVSILRAGIDKILFKDVSVYPNPNNGIVNIDMGQLKEVSVKVYNINGELIYQEERITNEFHQFELNAVPGVYSLELGSQGEKRQFILIRQ